MTDKIGKLFFILAACMCLSDCGRATIATTYNFNVVGTATTGQTHSVPMTLTLVK